ncbi:MAG: hypothetical protein M3004_12540 [Bacteroidota bacterium]|nr:hypothetical protein [Bacteroidota bacterium]
MKNIVLLVVFVLGIVFMQFVQAQNVDDIINKYVEARGGKEKLAAITSIYMEGSRQMMGNEVSVKVTIVQGKLYRTDFEFGGTSGFSIVTPTQGWSYVPMRSQAVEQMPADALKTMQGQLDIAGPLIDYAAKGNKVELQGKETIDGKEAYKIKLTSSDGKETFFCIDTKTNLLIQTKQVRTGANGKSNEIITNYSDYKSFDGVMFPQTVANPGSGVMGGSTTFDTIVLNKKIGDDQYKPAK